MSKAEYDVQKAYRPIITNGLPKLAYSEDKNSDYYRFWDEQFRRCIAGYRPEGYAWIPGRLYFYLNFCKIKVDDATGQRKVAGSPMYRELDYDLAMLFEKAKVKKKGVIEPKAREVGATVSAVCMTILHEVVFFQDSEVAIAAGSEDEIKAAKEVLNLAYNELPDEMRSDMLDENKELWRFGFVTHELLEGGKKGIDKEVGLKSIIHFKDSLNRKPNQLNSYRLAWVFVDECGLINGLKDIHILNRASFESNLVQFGCPIYAGTAKSFNSKDNDYEYMYENADKFNLLRMFIPKRRSMMKFMDKKTGKVDEAAAQAEIEKMYEPYRGNQVELAKIQQEYPSEPEHCWLRKSGGLLPLQMINDWIKEIRGHKTYNPRTGDLSSIEIGNLKWRNGRFGGEVEWYPTEKGVIRILQHPVDNLEMYKNLYVGGVDPYTKEATVETDSMGACYIYKRLLGSGVDSGMFVAEYIDRPQGVIREAGKSFTGKQIFYNNLYKLCVYYGCKILVEDTDSELFSWFRENTATRVLAYRPMNVINAKTSQQNKYGVTPSEGTITVQTGLLDKCIQSGVDKIFFTRLLMDLKGWGAKNTDNAMAAAYALMYDEDLNLKRQAAREERRDQIQVSNVGGAEFIRDEYGRLVELKTIFHTLRINYGK